MELLTPTLTARLLANGREQGDHWPVVKLFAPVGAATWLLTELDSDGDTLFGLADLGIGCPELGSVSLAELRGITLPLGLGIERDLHFEAAYPLSVYTEAARLCGHLTEQTSHLTRAAAALAARKARSPP